MCSPGKWGNYTTSHLLGLLSKGRHRAGVGFSAGPGLQMMVTFQVNTLPGPTFTPRVSSQARKVLQCPLGLLWSPPQGAPPCCLPLPAFFLSLPPCPLRSALGKDPAARLLSGGDDHLGLHVDPVHPFLCRWQLDEALTTALCCGRGPLGLLAPLRPPPCQLGSHLFLWASGRPNCAPQSFRSAAHSRQRGSHTSPFCPLSGSGRTGGVEGAWPWDGHPPPGVLAWVFFLYVQWCCVLSGFWAWCH